MYTHSNTHSTGTYTKASKRPSPRTQHSRHTERTTFPSQRENNIPVTQREPTWEHKALSGSDSILPASWVIGGVNPIGSPYKQGRVTIGVTSKRTEPRKVRFRFLIGNQTGFTQAVLSVAQR